MAKMSFDNEGLVVEPCLSCEKSYIEDIWNEWCCDEKNVRTDQKGILNPKQHQLRQVFLSAESEDK